MVAPVCDGLAHRCHETGLNKVKTMKVVLSKDEVCDILLADKQIKAIFDDVHAELKITMSPIQVTIEEYQEGEDE